MYSGNVTCVIGGLASSLGRKGTVSDVTLYNNKTGDSVLSFIEPSSFPEKIQSLASSLNMSDQVLLKINSLDPGFAECLVAIDASGIDKGYLVLSSGITLDKLKPFIAGTVLENYSVLEEQVLALREKLSLLNPESQGEPVIQIDHCFTVKGVGTVALGVVKEGIVKKYDELTIYPTQGKTTVKSMQVHDNDVVEAVSGSRVGLCLKNIKPEDCPRGCVLSTREIEVLDALEAKAHISKYAKKGIDAGDIFLVNSSLNYVPAKLVSGSLEPGSSGKVSLELEKKIPIIDKRLLLLDPGRKAPRIFGFLDLR